ncbi:unnamed protein product [Callosobruchus maculatus]|uniref:General transcription factor IIH subunit 3 n=1 Tax=Callosobruchus maculatus TaxID=64391 RepID=A0A653C811_CALMS|nr:unnamed protein product [Callosobruchus maculatus]
MNECKKLKLRLSSSAVSSELKSAEDYKKEILKLKQTLNDTLEANYNLSIKFLRMKNTKTCLKTELKAMKLEHDKLQNDYKARIESLTAELNTILDEKLDSAISPSSKKYMQLVKQNSCLVYENLCLQLEVDNLNLKLEHMKLEKTRSETNSRLSYMHHDNVEQHKLTCNTPKERKKGIMKENAERNSHVLTHVVESVIAFANSHLMQKAQNKLAIMACHSRTSQFIYPGPGKPQDIRQVDGQYEAFTVVEKTTKQNLTQLLASETSTVVTESLLAGAIAMALCYILNCRILVVTGSDCSASQYMNYMNVFFTAQKKSIVIDVCALDQHLSLLQQGCDITGGLYLKVPQLQGLLQYLLWVFLPEPPIREKLVLPPPVKVDYRAACFCHRELIDIGYVCSVCLSTLSSKCQPP